MSDHPVVAVLDVRVGNEVGFAFRVTNQGAKRVELTFPSGQTHDIAVMDAAGREVWRWSEGRLFTQALQNRVLESSESLTYSAAWKPVAAHGTFTAVATLISENEPLEHRVEFSIP